MVVELNFHSLPRSQSRTCAWCGRNGLTEFPPHFLLRKANMTSDSPKYTRVVGGQACNRSARTLLKSPACVWASIFIEIDLSYHFFPVAASPDLAQRRTAASLDLSGISPVQRAHRSIKGDAAQPSIHRVRCELRYIAHPPRPNGTRFRSVETLGSLKTDPPCNPNHP